LAEQGIGRPGLLVCQSAIQLRRLIGPDFVVMSFVAFVTVLFWLSENWAGKDTDDDTAASEDGLNEDERGAKTMVSV